MADVDGTTVIAPRVAQRLAQHAARRASSPVSGRVGRGALPAVELALAGSRARVGVRVAAPWPEPAAETAALVRDRVRAELDRWAGITVDDIVVTVCDVVDVAPSARRRLE